MIPAFHGSWTQRLRSLLAPIVLALFLDHHLLHMRIPLMIPRSVLYFAFLCYLMIGSETKRATTLMFSYQHFYFTSMSFVVLDAFTN